MAKFEKGTVVINVNTKEKGTIIKVLPIHRGRQFYDIMIGNNIIQCSESNLIEDLDLKDPYEKLKRNIYSSFECFLQSNTIFKIENTSINNISTLKSSKTLFRAYQFKPLLKLLNSNNRRLLVADEVGLGKTIEAGHIMLELKARRELKTVLIVCPISLQHKWQDELSEKFNLKFKIYESISDLVSDFKHQTVVMGIINYEKIRLPKSKNNEKQSCKKNNKQHFIDYLQQSYKHIDMIVCDEAHRARNSETQTYKGLRALMNYTKAALFLTATPIMISRENLFNLLRLLNEQEYNSYSIFENALRINEPFIQALSRLNNRDDFRQIAEDLQNTIVTTLTQIGDYQYPEIRTVAERFNGIPLYEDIIKVLKEGVQNDETRVNLQFDISALSKMNNIFSRTRKREVTQDYSQAERNPHTYYISLHTKERIEYDNIIEQYIADNSYIDEWGCDVMRPGSALGLVQKKRQISSSVYAFLNNIGDLEDGIDRYKDLPDAKFEQLLKIVDEVVIRNDKKIIVFALFHKTLHYLKIRLKSRGYESILMYGATPNRADLLSSFKRSGSQKILLTSEVGGEGLDMQFCDAMVNYDLPWNPMVVEQRIGRIDRFGQKSPKINIYNLIIEDSIQEIIYKRLLDRIGIFRSSIGDLEAILDRDLEKSGYGSMNLREYFSTLEKELYTTHLSKSEQKRKIEDVAKAIITEQKNAELIEEQLTNALTNDISFKNEIDKIINRKQYVTDFELLTLFQQLLKLKLTTCILDEIDNKRFIYRLSIPKSTPRVFTNFLSEYQPSDPELAEECINLRNKLRDETEILLTFSQDTAYSDKSLIFINSFHPIILCALEFFKRNTDINNHNTFKYKISNNQIPKGNYCLAMYELIFEQTKFGTTQETKSLFPVMYDLNNYKIIKDTELVKNIWGEIQSDAQIMSTCDILDSSLIDTMKIDLSDAIQSFYHTIYDSHLRRMESVKILDIQRAQEYYNSQIQRQKEIISENEIYAESFDDEELSKKARQILPALKGRLASIEEDMNKEISRISSMGMQRRSPQLKSLSYITNI